MRVCLKHKIVFLIKLLHADFRTFSNKKGGALRARLAHHGGDDGARDGELQPQQHRGGGDGPFEQQGTDAEVWHCVELFGEESSGITPQVEIILMVMMMTITGT